MHGLRFKILLGFGGLLVMLLAVSLLGEIVLDRYIGAMQRTFVEDYQSAKSCEDLAHAVDRIDTALQLHFWKDLPLNKADVEASRKICDQELDTQRAIATLPGEKEATECLATRWAEFKTIYPRLLDDSTPEQDRKLEYIRLGLQSAIGVQAAAHELIDMNMDSMSNVHGRAREMAEKFKWAMHILTATAVALAIVFAAFIGRFIIRPVALLTDSVRQIERGNLDLRVTVRSKDELGALAVAVNAMAAQLKAYRQADRERLVRTERTTQLAIDSLPDAVIVVNPDRRIELANETAKRLFNFAPGTPLSHTKASWLGDLFERVLRSGATSAPSGYEMTIQVEDSGGVRIFLPRAVPIIGENQALIGATVVLADVTGLHRLDEMKNSLLALVSHELKTPLTSMRMVLHLVADQRVGTLNAKQQELLDTARDDAERLHSIVENLLDMERIESGRALMELQPVSPAALVERAVTALRGTFEAQQVSLALAIPDDLPNVNADPIRVCHVLMNLLNNALRYVAPGGNVRIWARAADDLVEFGVTDDGLGISRQYLPRVFEKFFRIPGQQGSSGSGLGLSIAKDIVEAHGGRIRVDSEPGRGTTVAFTLRRAEIHAEPVGVGMLTDTNFGK